MRWTIILLGDRYTLKLLSERTSVDLFKVVQVENEFLLESKEFENLASNNDVDNIGQELISFLNGLVFHKYNISSSIKSGGVMRFREDGKRDIFLKITETIKSSARLYEPTITLKKIDGEIIVNKPGQHFLDKVGFAWNNLKARKIFRLMQVGDLSFATIYKIVEILQSEKGSALYKWVSKNKIDLLMRTANHNKAIGDEARHGVSNVEPPKIPMKLEEARSIVSILVDKFLAELNSEGLRPTSAPM